MQQAGFATLLFDLLTAEEERVDQATGRGLGNKSSPLDEADRALEDLAAGRLAGAAVLQV